MSLPHLLLAAAIPLALAETPARAGDTQASVTVTPSDVRIGFFYSGQELEVASRAGRSMDVVLTIRGKDEPLTLKRKGRKFGFLWMNVGEVHYEAVPVLYMLRSSRPLEEVAPLDVLDRLGIGLESLHHAVSEGTGREVFDELVKLKESDRLYSIEEGGVTVSPAEGGGIAASSLFELPAKAPVGHYDVDFFGFEGGQGERLGTAGIELGRSRSVSFVTGLLERHGLLYGCMAVTIAVIAGLGTGLIFGMGKGGSH
jgi:uncharacterized protein (TIGR02186 family)